MKIFWATIDPTWFDDGLKLCVAATEEEADILLLAAGCNGGAVEIPGLSDPGPARIVLLAPED